MFRSSGAIQSFLGSEGAKNGFVAGSSDCAGFSLEWTVTDIIEAQVADALFDLESERDRDRTGIGSHRLLLGYIERQADILGELTGDVQFLTCCDEVTGGLQ